MPAARFLSKNESCNWIPVRKMLPGESRMGAVRPLAPQCGFVSFNEETNFPSVGCQAHMNKRILELHSILKWSFRGKSHMISNTFFAPGAPSSAGAFQASLSRSNPTELLLKARRLSLSQHVSCHNLFGLQTDSTVRGDECET